MFCVRYSVVPYHHWFATVFFFAITLWHPVHSLSLCYIYICIQLCNYGECVCVHVSYIKCCTRRKLPSFCFQFLFFLLLFVAAYLILFIQFYSGSFFYQKEDFRAEWDCRVLWTVIFLFNCNIEFDHHYRRLKPHWNERIRKNLDFFISQSIVRYVNVSVCVFVIHKIM